MFVDAGSPGQQDLRNLLRAYCNYSHAMYRRELAVLAGALLIHCVAEEAFWLLVGLVGGALRDYYATVRYETLAPEQNQLIRRTKWA